MNQAGFITITGAVITTAASINANVAAPIITNTGMVNLITGAAVTSVFGGGLLHAQGGKVETIASGENIIKGEKIKMN